MPNTTPQQPQQPDPWAIAAQNPVMSQADYEQKFGQPAQQSDPWATAAQNPGQPPASTTQQSPSWLDDANASVAPQSSDSTITQIGKSIGRLALGLPNLAHVVGTPPQTPEEMGAYGGGGQAAVVLKRLLYDPAARAYESIDATANGTRQRIQAAQSSGLITSDHATEALNRLDKFVLAGKALASLPIIGPWALSEGNQVQSGQLGAAGALTDVAAPVVADAAIPALSDAASAVKSAVTRPAEVAGTEMATRPVLSASTEAGTQAVKNVASDVAEGTEPAASLRDTFQPAQESAKQTAKSYYKVADDATGGQLQPVLDKIDNISKAIRRGVDPDAFERLTAQKAELQAHVNDLIDEAQTTTTKTQVPEGAEPLDSENPLQMSESKTPNGLDVKGSLDKAKAFWTHQSALDDLNDLFNKKSNVSGPRPSQVLPNVQGVPKETINFRNLASDINTFDPERLQEALTPPGSSPAAGQLRAQQLTTAVNLAAKEGWAPAMFHKTVGLIVGHKAGAVARALF
jgi:hypothetical protein